MTERRTGAEDDSAQLSLRADLGCRQAARAEWITLRAICDSRHRIGIVVVVTMLTAIAGCGQQGDGRRKRSRRGLR